MRRSSPRSCRLSLAAVLAGATASAACAVQIPSPLSHAAAASTRHVPPVTGRQPWFAMTVTPGNVGFWEPSVLPAGAPSIAAKAGILVDMDTGEILWERQPHLELPPASMTKVLTSLVALENFSPDRSVTVTPDALGQSAADTLMHIRAGESLTVMELLDGMLLASGDDAASAIAVDTVGEQRFIAAMNAQVAALGLRNSSFSNTSGLDERGLYTSPYDMAAIATFAYDESPLFDQIVDTAAVTLAATVDHHAFHLHNLDALLGDYPGAVGIKPGWTGGAGACLVGMAVRGGRRLMAVLMHAVYPARVEAHLLDWGFHVEGLPLLLPPSPAPKPASAA